MRARLGIGLALAATVTGVAAASASFAGDGYETLDFGGVDSATAVAIQKSGRIVTAGATTAGGSVFDFAIAGFTKGGAVDGTFSNDGRVYAEFGGFESAEGIAIRDRGKIVVAGSTDAVGERRFALVGLTKNGNPDNSLSQDGRVLTKFPAVSSAADVAVQGNGRIVVAGRSGYNFAVARYTERGKLDRTFGGDGRVTINFGGADNAEAVAIQRNGKIVVGGFSCVGGGMCSGDDFVLARLKRGGGLDHTFSGDGRVRYNLGGSDRVFDLAIQRDGRIVAAGSTLAAAGDDFAAIRLKPNGKLDRTFSGDGKQRTGFGGSESARALVIQPDGRIVMVGTTDATPTVDFALVRYRPNGKLDRSFDSDGRLTTDIGGGGDAAEDIAMLGRNRFVVAGFDGPSGDVVVARYSTAGQLDD